jgi:hypothetical protein
MNVTPVMLPPGRLRGPRLGFLRRVGQALATEAMAKCIREGGVWEAEANLESLGHGPAPAAVDRMPRSRWKASNSNRASRPMEP